MSSHRKSRRILYWEKCCASYDKKVYKIKIVTCLQDAEPHSGDPNQRLAAATAGMTIGGSEQQCEQNWILRNRPRYNEMSFIKVWRCRNGTTKMMHRTIYAPAILKCLR